MADKIKVELTVADAKRLRAFVDCSAPERPEDKSHDLTPEEWERVEDAIVDAIREYEEDGDVDDGRAFTDAKDRPFYEP